MCAQGGRRFILARIDECVQQCVIRKTISRVIYRDTVISLSFVFLSIYILDSRTGALVTYIISYL